jgi:two-component system cell cycle response regulator DivK
MKRILIVEDNEDNLYLIKFILQQNRYEVIEARDGAAGVKLAIKEKPDLILMDIQLPDINGLEATKLIRSSEINDTIPIIALTSYAMQSDKEKALAAGCTGFIEKPIDPKTTMKKIQQYL